jgi:hypothetical protein
MLLTTLLEPFQFSFMVNAMLVATIVAIPCALLSVFLVLKGWALMGDAMSHAVFPGVVVAYISGSRSPLAPLLPGYSAPSRPAISTITAASSAIPLWALSFPGCLAPGWCCMSPFSPKSISTIFCLATCWGFPPAILGKRRRLH